MPESIKLIPRTLVCPCMPAPEIDGKINDRKWSAAKKYTDFQRTDGQPSRSKTTLWLGHDNGYLYAAVRCDEKNTAALSRHSTPNNRGDFLQSGDRVAIHFDTAHDHVGVRWFEFGPFDQMENFQGTSIVGYRDGRDTRWHISAHTAAYANYCRSAAHVEEGKYWSVEMAIPFESLGVAPPVRGTVWGVNVLRSTRWPVYQKEAGGSRDENSTLSPCPGYYPVPVAFADLVFDADDALALAELDLGIPHFGENRSFISFTAPREKTPLTVIGRVRSRKSGKIIDPGAAIPLQPHVRGGLAGELAWKPFFSDDTNVLDIEVKRAGDGKVEWRGSYDLGWEAGSLPIYYLHSGESDTPPLNPEPGDPDFPRKKAAFIAGRQPRFRRVNTAQGAPSDFTLESSDGQTRFNLMEAGVADRMARYIHGLYETDADRLMGMMFFMGQSCMMRAHTAYDEGGAARLNPLSMLRFGTGHCGHHSTVMSPFINRMPKGDTGEFHKARTAMIGGHALVIVEYRGDYAVLDAKHCCMFYTLDNTDLATLAEIRREPEIVRRTYPHWIMPALMTFDERYVAAAEPDSFDTDGYSYPSGAPLA